MFLRRFERRKKGKPHSYWALVESYRIAKGSRRPQLSLFDPPRRDEPRDDEPLLVKLSSVRLERTRDFGDVWLAWGLWRMLGVDAATKRL